MVTMTASTVYQFISPHGNDQHRQTSSRSLPSNHPLSHSLDEQPFYFTDPPLSWTPFYLRRRVLLAFLIVFVFIIAVVESLLAVSQKNDGISTSSPARHYVWTFGPTAFLTGIAALWARTEYQSKLVAPWIRLWQHEAPASSTLLLDYVSQFSIFALATSLRKRDFFVSIAIAVSLIIKILIVLSSGLVTLSLTAVSQDNYPAILQDNFVNTSTRTRQSGIAKYVLQGLWTRNLTLPDGISSDYAFQTVRTDLPDTVEIGATVDGLGQSLNCEAVEMKVAGARSPDPHLMTYSLNITLSSANCDVALVSLPGISDSGLFARFSQVQCDQTDGDEGKRVLLIFGNLTYTYDYSQNMTIWDGGYRTVSPAQIGILNRSTQLLCIPSYSIDRVVVTRNGTLTKSVLPVQGATSRTLDSITEWDIMDFHFSQIGSAPDEPYGKTMNISMVPVDVSFNLPMELALDYYLTPGSQASDLYRPELLQQTIANYYRQIAAIIVKQSFMAPAVEKTTVSTTTNENRLVVRSWVAQWMAGLAAACVLLTLTTLCIAPCSGFLPRSPTALPDLCSILSQSHELLARLRYAGAADFEHLTQLLTASRFRSEEASDSTLAERWFRVVDIDTEIEQKAVRLPQISSNLFHPISLHPAASSALCLTIVAIIILLEILLSKSNREHGLGDVDDDTYVHYAWTTVPALIFGLLSMIFSSIDFEIRSLAPYMVLDRQVPKSMFINFELTDMTIPKAIYRSIRFRTLWAFATTMAFLSASLFTTFSASLFQESSVPIVASITLRANQSFLWTVDGFLADDSEVTSSLILESNYSFPRFTHINLAFPELMTPVELSTNSTFNASAVSITAVVPAIRPRMDCYPYGSAQMYWNATPSSFEDKESQLRIWIDGEDCHTSLSVSQSFDFWVKDNTSYIGQTTSRENAARCSDLLYLWGMLDHGETLSFSHIIALGCNVTFEGIDVSTTFVGSHFDLDSQKPPFPLEDTVRLSTFDKSTKVNGLPAGEAFQLSADGPNGPGEPLLNPFFSALVTSPWAIPLSALSEPSASADVMAAIQFQQKLLETQALAALRVPANMTNSTLAGAIGPEDNDAQPTYNATVIDATSRRRVVQDATATHILVSLLSTALVLFIVGWATRPSTAVLPRRPTSIASVMALLAGGNILSRLPADAQRLSREDIATAAGDAEARFYMGWGNLPDEEGQLMGGENEAGVSQFGIFVVDKDVVTK
ncbi:hypothetical protein F5Y03DRAFT_151944 [Xylaria venustula]|nr:hypothetical protein F5Y03DRAFT_151944 [Xylaria venustula]